MNTFFFWIMSPNLFVYAPVTVKINAIFTFPIQIKFIHLSWIFRLFMDRVWEKIGFSDLFNSNSVQFNAVSFNSVLFIEVSSFPHIKPVSLSTVDSCSSFWQRFIFDVVMSSTFYNNVLKFKLTNLNNLNTLNIFSALWILFVFLNTSE